MQGLANPAQLSDFNSLVFVIERILKGVQTGTIVEVMACTNAGGLSPTGTVDIKILVQDKTANDEPISHETIYDVPYMRIQGGTDAFILDPKKGDIGICLFASKDITKVKKTKKEALPDSERTHHYSDGLYIGGILNGIPSQFIQFESTGITITSPNDVNINAAQANIVTTGTTSITASKVNMTAPSNITGDMNLTGSITASVAINAPTMSAANSLTVGGKEMSGHDHYPGSYTAGTTPVTGNSGAPV